MGISDFEDFHLDLTVSCPREPYYPVLQRNPIRSLNNWESTLTREERFISEVTKKPNIGGQTSEKRTVLYGVVYALLLYSILRKSAYRTVSTVALQVLTVTVPIDVY